MTVGVGAVAMVAAGVGDVIGVGCLWIEVPVLVQVVMMHALLLVPVVGGVRRDVVGNVSGGIRRDILVELGGEFEQRRVAVTRRNLLE